MSVKVEILADMRWDHPIKDDGIKHEGDIIVVQPEGTQWGRGERKIHLITTLDVEGTQYEWLHSKLEEQRANGEPYPKLIEPFALYDWQDYGGEAIPIRVTRSIFKIDKSKFSGSMALEPTMRVSSPSKPVGLGRDHLKLSDLHEDRKARILYSRASQTAIDKVLTRGN